MCESTVDAIEALYPRFSRGGYGIVDDLRERLGLSAGDHGHSDMRGIAQEIVDIDGYGAYWREG